MKRGLLPLAALAGMLLAPAAALAAGPSLPGGGIEAYGARGGQVAILQADLAALHVSPGPIDGDFGPMTLRAVRRYQAIAGIGVDGVAGPTTWGAIHSGLTRHYHLTTGELAAVGADYGDVGAPVVQLQQDLIAKGFHPGPANGVYLTDTAQAVQAYERSAGLPLSTRLYGRTLSDLTGTAAPQGGQSGQGTNQGGQAASQGAQTSTGSGSSSATGSTIDGHPVVREIGLTATAYGPSPQDNYPYGAVDYFGHPLVAGDVAVDPSVIPLGTLLWVTGYSSPNLPQGGFLARAVDTGGAIKGDRIDIFINQSDAVVNNFGIQQVQAYILGN